ncbi:MAG: hypothetical protein ACJAYU_004508 [Bradymonadia bacterium]|jgi:hypothetical protein
MQRTPHFLLDSLIFSHLADGQTSLTDRIAQVKTVFTNPNM